MFETRNLKEWDALVTQVKDSPKKYWDDVSTKKDLDRLDSLLRDSGWSVRTVQEKDLKYVNENIPVKEIYGKFYLLVADGENIYKKERKIKMTLTEWQEKMLEEIEGDVFISCTMQNVPWHKNTSRYQVYNSEGTYDKSFDITVDDEGNIIELD